MNERRKKPAYTFNILHMFAGAVLTWIKPVLGVCRSAGSLARNPARDCVAAIRG
jgi:hypothetical protein